MQLLEVLSERAKKTSSSGPKHKRELILDDDTVEQFGMMCEEIVRLNDSCGNAGLVIAFSLLENMVVKIDTSSIASIHEKVFEHCLVALGFRWLNLEAIQNTDDLERSVTIAMAIDDTERSVINAIVALMKRLSESVFKRLFDRSIIWAK